MKKIKIASVILFVFIYAACKSNFYTKDDFHSVLKIDSHSHIDTDKGILENQAIKDNFKLLTSMSTIPIQQLS